MYTYLALRYVPKKKKGLLHWKNLTEFNVHEKSVEDKDRPCRVFPYLSN